MSWTVWGSNPSRDKNNFFFFSKKVQTGPGVNLTSHTTGTRAFYPGRSGQSVRETTHLHLVLMLNEWSSTSAPLYTFMTWTGTNWTFTFTMWDCGGHNTGAGSSLRASVPTANCHLTSTIGLTEQKAVPSCPFLVICLWKTMGQTMEGFC